MAPGLGGPNIAWPPAGGTPAKGSRTHDDETVISLPTAAARVPAFEGDVAIRELRHRLSLDPEAVPQPPLRARRNPVVPWLVRLSLVFAVAAAAAYGLALLPFSENEPATALKQDKGTPVAAAPTRVVAVPQAQPQQPSRPQLQSQPQPQQVQPQQIQPPPQPASLARLVVEGRQAFTNEPLPLGVGLKGRPIGNEVVVLSGLAPGTRLSAGDPMGTNGWRLPASDLGKVLAYAPRDFVGAMDVSVDLRGAGDTVVDSQVGRLEWLPKPRPTAAVVPPAAQPVAPPAAQPVPHALDPDEIATLMKRGQEFLQTGDIAAARLVLRRAANAGNAQAALALGATYDPVALVELGVLGFAPDPEQARTWYQRAAELGAPDASRRLERLARAERK